MRMFFMSLGLLFGACDTLPYGSGEFDGVDGDGDGYTVDADCNDANAGVYPGATELCDGADNDCDGQADEGCETPIDTDLDNDGHHVPARNVHAWMTRLRELSVAPAAHWDALREGATRPLTHADCAREHLALLEADRG